MPDLVVRTAQADFKIPAPRNQTSSPASQPQGSPAQGQPPSRESSQSKDISYDSLLPKGIATTDVAIGGAIFLALLVPFFFAKLSVTRSLQSQYAAPGPASGAGWMLFIWLAFTTLAVVAASVTRAWAQPILAGPAAAISLILLLLFLRKRSLALRTRR